MVDGMGDAGARRRRYLLCGIQNGFFIFKYVCTNIEGVVGLYGSKRLWQSYGLRALDKI